MFFAYRVGFPGWKVAAHLGIPLKIVVRFFYDEEAKVFVALSDDFNPQAGIAAEAEDWPSLVKEVKSQAEEALNFIFKDSSASRDIPVPKFISVHV